VGPSVVEPGDVIERGPIDALPVAPGALAMNEFTLLEAVERLGQGIVKSFTERAN